MKTLPGWLQSLKEYFSNSIGKKIIIPYAVLTVLLAVMGVFVITRLVAESFEDRLKNQLLDAGRVVSDEVVNRERLRLEIERVVANTIGVADAVIDRDFETLEELISPIIANAKIIDSIIIVDTQGKEVLRFQRETAGANVMVNTTPGSGLDLSDWLAVEEVLANPDGNKETQLAQDIDTGELIIYTVGPIRTTEGVVGAALVGTYLSQEVATLRELALAQLTLFDRTGQVMETTFRLNRADRAVAFSVFSPERYQQVVDEKEVTLLDQIEIPDTVTVADRDYRLAYAPFILRSRVYGVFAVALPTNFITRTTGDSRDWLILLFTVGVVIVFGVGYIVSRRISQPILELVETSEAISAGDLSRRTGIERPDEIGTLATTFDDMTAKLQHLLQLQEEEASKLTAILSSIADGVIVQDMAGTILVKNPAADKILAEVGGDFAEAFPVDARHRDANPGQARKHMPLHDYLTELEFREKKRLEIGHKVLSALAAPVVTSDNVQQGFVVVLRDITAEVESQKLKDDFITSVSHELKTPLAAIKGYNQLLRMMHEMKAADEADDRQLAILDTMDKELTDLDDLIQAMLDLSQIDAGELGIDREPLDLAGLIEEEVSSWQEKMSERELSLTAHLSGEPVWVEGDQSRLTRVLHNLIKNAHDYTLPGGNVEISLTRENGRVQVDIKDTGVGISQEDQRFLFSRFFRAIHDENTYEQAGAGLGLYVSKAIVEAHDGKIWMQSEPNHGSTFSFALSIVDPDDYELEA
jgi:signal transduction histidine kinase